MFEEEIKKIFSLEDYTIDRIKRECDYERRIVSICKTDSTSSVFDFLKKMKNLETSMEGYFSEIFYQKDPFYFEIDPELFSDITDESETDALLKSDKNRYPEIFLQWIPLLPKAGKFFSPVYYIDLFNALLSYSIKENDFSFMEGYLVRGWNDIYIEAISKENDIHDKDKGNKFDHWAFVTIISIQKTIFAIINTNQEKEIEIEDDLLDFIFEGFSVSMIYEIINDIQVFIDSYCKEDKEYDQKYLYVLYWFAQILSLVSYIEISLTYEVKGYQYSLTDGISYLSYLFADMSWNNNQYQNGILFSRLALDILLPDIKQESYNLLGLCAIDSGEKQLAYDAYYSWLNRKSIGEIPFTDNETTSALDEKWRKSKDGIKKEALMRSNLSYVSSMIYSGLEKGTPDRQYFYIIAKEQIEKAIELNGEEASYYCTKSSILSDSEEHEEHKDALISCEEYKDRSASNKQDLVSALRQCVEMQLDLMTEGVLQRGVCFDRERNMEYSVFVDYLEKYNKAVHDEDKSSINEEYDHWKSYQSLFNLRSYCDKNSIEVKLEYILLVIFNLSALIRQELSRSDYNYTKYFTRIPEYDDKIRGHQKEVKPIAYYTSLNTATFLFTPIGNEYKKEAEETKPEEKKNCFTVMHAQYMNDPNEGLPLLNALFGNTGFNSLEVRNELYRNRFTFIKSFTESIDSFIMWNRYGRNKGGDSDGCCLQIHPMTFDELVDESRVRGKKRNDFAATQDDYHLYRIVYLSEDGTILDEHNKDLPPKIKEYYSYLRKMFEELDKELQNTNENFKAVVSDFLQYCFRYIAFLFKDAVYSSEKESRIIMLRSLDQTDLISTVSQEPPMLCVKPYFQVYINEIIFGPTCHETEKWEPYFQYSLSKMWKDFTPEEKPGKPPYTIRRSKIKYNP